MLAARTKAQLIAFVVIGLLATTYLGTKYVGINLFGSGYNVTVVLPDAGGIFDNGEVTYRGVPVGRIKDLNATKNGMEARLHIDEDAPPIPADVAIKVANRSAIGEQYIDLRSESTGGRTLTDGARIEGSAASLPPAIDEVLRTGRDFIGSVPADSLTTVIDETYDAAQGSSGHLTRLLKTSQEFVETADKNFLVTEGLINNSATVLSTQQDSAASIKSFSSDLSLLATTLRSSNRNLRTLIANSPAAAREINRLFNEVGRPLGVLMGNLVSTAQIFGTNSAGVEDALIRVPEVISIGWAVNGSKGINVGLVQTYFNPEPCTSGYGGTEVRPGLDTSEGEPYNTKAGCTVSPSSGTAVRGPRSVPKPGEGPAAARISVPNTMQDLLGGAR